MWGRLIGITLSLVLALPVLAQGTVEKRLWISNLDERHSRQATLRVHYIEEHSLPGTVLFDVEIEAPEPMHETHLVLTLMDSNQAKIHSGEIRLGLNKGVSRAQFTWTPQNVSDGLYTAVFDLHRRTGGDLAQRRLAVRLLSSPNIQTAISSVKSQLTSLQTTLDRMRQAGSLPAYPMLRAAIIEDYLPHAEAALGRGDWRQADEFVQYLSELATHVTSQLSIVSPATESFRTADNVPATPVTVESGTFVHGGRPRFMFGAAQQPAMESLLPILQRYGLNMAVYSVSPVDALAQPDSSASFAATLADFLNRARRAGVNVVLQTDPGRLPAWALDRHPDLATNAGGSFAFNLLDPAARTLLKRHMDTVMDATTGHPNVMSVSLAQNPQLSLPEPILRKGLITLARARYKDHDLMNRAWQTRYMDFDEIEVDFGSRHRAYRYDLEIYHQELGTQLFGWLAEMARVKNPALPLQVQFADSMFTLNESMSGIDRESVASITDISGCAVQQPLDSVALGMGPPAQALYYTLLRSFDRSAPVMNTEDGIVTTTPVVGQDGYRRVRTMMWESVLAGLNGSAIRMGEPGAEAVDRAIGVLDRPEYIDGYATANLDLNRLAPMLTAFQNAPAPVAILWSTSSKILDHGDPYLDSVRRAYEGCANFGFNVRFITERQCELQGLNDVEVLVIPRVLALSTPAFNAIDAYIQAGGMTIRQGMPIPYNEHGLSRTDTISVSTRTVLIRGADTPRAYLDALDAAYSMDSVGSIPRAVNEFGYPVDGVKTRFVVHQQIPYLYLVNLRTEPATVQLAGDYTAGLDLVSGNRMQFPDTIEPLTPMLIQFDRSAATERLVANETVQGIPAVELTPVVDPAEKIPQTPRTAMRHGR